MWRWLKRFKWRSKEDEIIEYFLRKSSQSLIQGHYGAAIRYLDQALEFRPKSNRIFLARGVIYYEGLKNIPEALNCLKTAANFPADRGMKDEMARNRARDLIRKIMQQGGDSVDMADLESQAITEETERDES